MFAGSLIRAGTDFRSKSESVFISGAFLESCRLRNLLRTHRRLGRPFRQLRRHRRIHFGNHSNGERRNRRSHRFDRRAPHSLPHGINENRWCFFPLTIWLLAQEFERRPLFVLQIRVSCLNRIVAGKPERRSPFIVRGEPVLTPSAYRGKSESQAGHELSSCR